MHTYLSIDEVSDILLKGSVINVHPNEDYQIWRVVLVTEDFISHLLVCVVSIYIDTVSLQCEFTCV